MNLNEKRRARFAMMLVSTLFLLSPMLVLAETPYYQGKTITIIVGTAAGGTGEYRVRAIVPYLRKYIPGNPDIVLQFMAGGGGRTASNHLYNIARPDGLTVGVIGTGLVANAVLGAPGVKYDVDKFVYLGSSLSKFLRVFTTNKKLGLDTLEKLRAHGGLRIGGMQVGSEIYIQGRLFAYLLGLQEPVFIAGYGGAELDLALERGEVDARGNTVGTIMVRSPHWIERNMMDFHVTLEVPKGYDAYPHPIFENLPELETFAKSDKERALLQLYRVLRGSGSPFILPPGTPHKHVEILQEAFRKAYRDPGFGRDFKKFTAEDVAPIMPEEQEKLLREMPRHPDVIKLFNLLSGSEPLPPR